MFFALIASSHAAHALPREDSTQDSSKYWPWQAKLLRDPLEEQAWCRGEDDAERSEVPKRPGEADCGKMKKKEEMRRRRIEEKRREEERNKQTYAARVGTNGA